MDKVFGLTLDELVGKKVNMHTHTPRCQHARGTEREYVENAIQAGYEVLGFSDHAPYVFEGDYVSGIRMRINELEGYVRVIQDLKKEYQKDIMIYCGLEMEYLPGQFEKTIEVIKQYPMDYMIQGQHFRDYESNETYVGRPKSDERYLKSYVDHVLEGLRTGYFLYVAHPDLVHFTGEQKIWQKHMSRLLKELKKRNMPIEINVNGYRNNMQYPSERMVKLGVEIGNSFILGVDAHNPWELLDLVNYEKCKKMVENHNGIIIGC